MIEKVALKLPAIPEVAGGRFDPSTMNFASAGASCKTEELVRSALMASGKGETDGPICAVPFVTISVPPMILIAGFVPAHLGRRLGSFR